MQVRSLGQDALLEEGLAIHSSILAWRIPRTEEHGGLWSIGSQRVRHHWRDFTPTHWWMDKQNVVYHIIAYYSAIKKEWSTSERHGNIYKPKKHCTKRKEPDTEHPILSDSTYRGSLVRGVRFIETESRMVMSWSWRAEGIESSYLTCTEFQFCKMKTVLEMDDYNDCTTVWMYLMALNHTLFKKLS